MVVKSRQDLYQISKVFVYFGVIFLTKSAVSSPGIGFRLQLIQFEIKSPFFHQRMMGPVFDDPTSIQYENPVGASSR